MRFRRPRWLNRWFAEMFGYFWMPCHECGRMWGGHEPHGSAEIITEQWFDADGHLRVETSLVVCWRHTGPRHVTSDTVVHR